MGFKSTELEERRKEEDEEEEEEEEEQEQEGEEGENNNGRKLWHVRVQRQIRTPALLAGRARASYIELSRVNVVWLALDYIRI